LKSPTNSISACPYRYVHAKPKSWIHRYHFVGALDPIFDADIIDRVGDGLPETLCEWELAEGLTHIKAKLNGDDLNWDVQRLIAVDRAVSAAQLKGCKGQSNALLMAAAAIKFGMFLCVQYLTCPGASLIQSSSLAARHRASRPSKRMRGRMYLRPIRRGRRCFPTSSSSRMERCKPPI
jgi:hypothetical protein